MPETLPSLSPLEEPGGEADARVSTPSALSQRLWRRFQQEPLVNRAIVWTILAGTLFMTGYLVFQAWRAPRPVDPVFARIEHIKRVRHLRLVRHHYEGLIPVTKPSRNDKPGNLQFLLVAPARIDGYMDLGAMEIDLLPDSLLRVRLPEPQVSEVYLDLETAREYTLAGKGRFFGRRLERADYFEAYDQIRQAVAASQERVRAQALENGILTDTRRKAEDYLRHLARGLGYRVSFVPAADTLATPIPDAAALRSLLEAYLDESDQDLRLRKRDLIRNLLGL